MPLDELRRVIAAFCKRYDMFYRTIRPSDDKNENRRLIELFGMCGQSKALVDVALKIDKVAQSPSTAVLIRGESGSGKELVAKAIHDRSARSQYKFVAINCAAIPRDLLESELFGHKKGSFTGSVADQLGKLELANRGTVFLDEIGDMPLEMQSKLLRVLQERVITPVGDKDEKRLDVRFITATHRNLADMVKEGKFREDLLYRIKVVEIEVPPLRTRPDDVEPLVELFTKRYNEGRKVKKYFQRRALDVLQRYSWPGNVRELQAAVERHMVVSEQNLIRPEDLDLKLYGPGLKSRVMTMAEFRGQERSDELEFLSQAISDAGGNKAEAARRLEISATHLQYLLRGAGDKPLLKAVLRIR